MNIETNKFVKHLEKNTSTDTNLSRPPSNNSMNMNENINYDNNKLKRLSVYSDRDLKQQYPFNTVIENFFNLLMYMYRMRIETITEIIFLA